MRLIETFLHHRLRLGSLGFAGVTGGSARRPTRAHARRRPPRAAAAWHARIDGSPRACLNSGWRMRWPPRELFRASHPRTGIKLSSRRTEQAADPGSTER
jgi:hypothetical protein